VAVEAVHTELAGVDLMGKIDRLARTFVVAQPNRKGLGEGNGRGSQRRSEDEKSKGSVHGWTGAT
jgi:hypothetical protein